MWESVLLTALGGGLTVVGTIGAHHWQAAENRRVRREGYEREDRYRLFRDRVEAYRAFHQAASAVRPALMEYQSASRDQSLIPAIRKARNDAFSTFLVVRLIGDGDVVKAAARLMGEVDGVAWQHQELNPDRWGDLILDYICATRKDLIHEGDVSSEWLASSPPVPHLMTHSATDPLSRAGHESPDPAADHRL